MKKDKNKSKKIKMPNINTNDGELFQKICNDTVRAFNRVPQGKGSKRRIEDTKVINENWDEIDWSK
jgi:hypothetical protein